MSKSRVPLALGLAGAGGIGYYLYNAGGNPKAAEKKFEADAHRAAANVKSHLPGNSPDAKHYGKEAGAKIDNAIAEADKQVGRAKSNIEALGKDARAETLKAIDKFDAKVEEGAAKAKSGVSSWFGGSK